MLAKVALYLGVTDRWQESSRWD